MEVEKGGCGQGHLLDYLFYTKVLKKQTNKKPIHYVNKNMQMAQQLQE